MLLNIENGFIGLGKKSTNINSDSMVLSTVSFPQKKNLNSNQKCHVLSLGLKALRIKGSQRVNTLGK